MTSLTPRHGATSALKPSPEGPMTNDKGAGLDLIDSLGESCLLPF
ncbi:MAG: hypothetical protein ACKOU6_16510 [Planctomycetota bacterium]